MDGSVLASVYSAMAASACPASRCRPASATAAVMLPGHIARAFVRWCTASRDAAWLLSTPCGVAAAATSTAWSASTTCSDDATTAAGACVNRWG